MKLPLKPRPRLKKKEWKDSRSSKRMLRKVLRKKRNARRKELRLTKLLWLREPKSIKRKWRDWPSSKKRDKRLSMKQLRRLTKLLLPPENSNRSNRLPITRGDLRREELSSPLSSDTYGSTDQLVST